MYAARCSRESVASARDQPWQYYIAGMRPLACSGSLHPIRELVRRASELGFARGGAFAYSQEEGTPAAEMEDEMLDEEVRWARRDEMVAGFQARGRAWAHAQVGRTLRVMVDKMEGLDAVGRTEYDAPDIDSTVRIPAMPLAPGSVVNGRIVAADEVDLGRPRSTQGGLGRPRAAGGGQGGPGGECCADDVGCWLFGEWKYVSTGAGKVLAEGATVASEAAVRAELSATRPAWVELSRPLDEYPRFGRCA